MAINYSGRIGPAWRHYANVTERVLWDEYRKRRNAGLREIAVTFKAIAGAWAAAQNPRPTKAVRDTVESELQRDYWKLHRALGHVDRIVRPAVLPVNALYFTEKYTVDEQPTPLTRYHKRGGHPKVGIWVIQSEDDAAYIEWQEMQRRTAEGQHKASNRMIEIVHALPPISAWQPPEIGS